MYELLIEGLFGSIIFLFISIILLVRFRTLKPSIPLFLCLLTIFLRYSISLYNSYFGPIYGADVDAVDFVDFASHTMPLINIGTEAYLAFLGNVFSYTIRSTFIANILSVVVTLPYLFFVTWVLEKYSHSVPKSILILFSMILLFLPSMLIFHSISLREAYMISGLALIAFSGFRIIEENLSIRYLFLFILGSSLLAWFHKGTFIISLLNFVALAYILFIKGNRLVLLSSMASLSFLVLLLGGATIDGRGLEVLFAILSGESMEYVENYRLSSEGLQASNTYSIDYDSNIFIIAIKSFFYYTFGPFIGTSNGFFGLYMSLERLLILIMMLILLFNPSSKSYKNEHVKIVFSLILFFISSLIWSLGTSNYGTGIRHHTVHDFLLYIAVYISFSIRFNKKLNEA
tara:strand:- start:709 stop:1914 length:1206 start_codon:yes stop_codon:yes gene_type:complete